MKIYKVSEIYFPMEHTNHGYFLDIKVAQNFAAKIAEKNYYEKLNAMEWGEKDDYGIISGVCVEEIEVITSNEYN